MSFACRMPGSWSRTPTSCRVYWRSHLARLECPGRARRPRGGAAPGARPRGPGAGRSGAAAARAPDRAVGHPDRDLHLRARRARPRACCPPTATLVHDGARVVALRQRRRPLPDQPCRCSMSAARAARQLHDLRRGSLAVVPSLRHGRASGRSCARPRPTVGLPARRDGELSVRSSPPGPEDRDHRLRTRLHGAAGRRRATASPTLRLSTCWTVFNMTEIIDADRVRARSPAAAGHLRPAAPGHRGAARRRQRLRGRRRARSAS